VLHISALNDQFELVQSFINYAINYEGLQGLELTNWINKQNSEGFTALHYSSFRGNLVKRLI